MITVKYFANLKEIAGMAEERIQESELSFKDFTERVSLSKPQIAELIREKRVMVSVNHNVARSDTIIRSGDEVALLPPFSGGI